MPPIRAIEEWITVKRIPVETGRGTVRGRKRAFVSVSHALAFVRARRSLAFVIARAIAEHGIKPLPYLLPAFARMRLTIGRTVHEFLREAGWRPA